jgi:hypothetical protein
LPHLTVLFNEFGGGLPHQRMILEILPVQDPFEHNPAKRVRPFAIATSFPSRIGPYVLHFMQYPSMFVMMLSLQWVRWTI